MGVRIDILEGKKYNRLYAKEYIGKSSYMCICDCGNETIVKGTSLKKGTVKSCGCYAKELTYENDIQGKKFNKLTVIQKEPTGKFKCICDCGNITYQYAGEVYNSRVKSCGCLRRENLVGRTFGRLKVLEEYGKTNNQSYQYKCLCECGKEKIIIGTYLRNGKRIDCGEHGLTRVIKYLKKQYGQDAERIYKIHQKMIARCYQETSTAYHHYGLRGIKICEEWLGKEGAERFIIWSLNNNYKENLSVDRINNDEDYSPDNCRWVDMKQQARNRRNTIRVTYKNEIKSLNDWCEELNINKRSVEYRLKKGWSFEKVMAEDFEKIKFK